MEHHQTALAPCKLAAGKPCPQCTDLQRFRSKQGRNPNPPPSGEERLRAIYSAINYSHDPFIHKLPLEIASEIFTHCLVYLHSKPDSSVERAAPLVLGAVCRTWRQIAWSTPKLWNSMFFEVSSDRYDNDGLRMELVRDWLARSGCHPLYITIRVHREATVASLAPLFPLVDLLDSYASRWQVLSLHAPSALLSRFNSPLSIPQGAGLTELSIKPSNYPVVHSIDLMSITATLSKLTIALIPPLLIHIHFERLTHISATNIYSSGCMELLRLAPQLEECTFNMMETTEPGDPDPPTNNIAMPNLRALFFGANCEDRLDVFLVKLYLPVLEELHIDSITNLEPPIDLVSHFARWRCPLRRLLLSDHETQEMDMKRVLLQVPTLEYLHLSSSENNPAACDVLYALADRLGSADGTVAFLPRLKTFESFNTPPTFSWDVIPRIFSVSFDGVDPISPASLPPRPVLQRVIIHVNPEPDTNEVDQETMRRYLYLKRIGIELDIDPPLLSSHHSSV